MLGLVGGLLAMLMTGGAMLLTLAAADMWPTETAYTAVYWMFVSWTGFHMITGTILLLYMIARAVAGKIGPDRRQSLQNVETFWHFTTGLALISLAMIHLWPRMI